MPVPPPPDAVVLVGHGAVPTDFPRGLVLRMKALEAARRAAGEPPGEEERGLDARLRHWPRTPATDPYAAGLALLAARLRARLPGVPLAVAYNEFCAPAVDEAVDRLAAAGCRRVVVVPTMLTPGGVHADLEIPETLARLRARHPRVDLRYAWPADLELVAELLVALVARA
jgi:sirohydrochlorin cobaltochelatase